MKIRKRICNYHFFFIWRWEWEGVNVIPDAGKESRIMLTPISAMLPSALFCFYLTTLWKYLQYIILSPEGVP